MMKRIVEKKEQRAKAIADARVLVDRAQAEDRDLTEEESASYDAALADAEKLEKEIRREEHLLEQERAIAAADAGRRDQEEGRQPGQQQDAEQRALAFRGWLRQAGKVSRADMPEVERRALEATTDSAGGYLVPPVEWVNMLLKNVDDLVFIRALGTGATLPTAASLGMPYLSADPADSDWTTELGTGSEDSTMAFGKRELSPHPLAKRLKVSNQLLRQAPNAEDVVRDRLGYKMSITMEKAYLTGTGASQPLGIFTASNDGIPTSRDASTGNTTTSIGVDGLIEAKYTLKGQYLTNSQWLFHRDAVKQISKLKDGQGQYLWQPSVQMGEPDMLLGRPVNTSEYAPNTFTTGLYVGAIADFSYYYYVDALNMQIQRLVELYAETAQTGFISRYEGDGMPVLSEAFVRVKLA